MFGVEKAAATTKSQNEKWDLDHILKNMVFFGIHLGCLGVIWTGTSWIAVAVCILLYIVRMFAITGGYHRYFSHRSYKTSRVFQFLLGLLGTTAGQKGPLWWAGHHRQHHRHSDDEDDVHSPIVKGIWWAHIGWVVSTKYVDIPVEDVQDLAKYPELRWLDNNHRYTIFALAVAVFLFGYWLGVAHPALGTNGMQMLVWGFFISTTALYHGTFLVNSAAHIIGKRRFNTTDFSRNSWLVAIFTLGEGWHNNHHRYPGSERQGFYWWELDISHYILRALSFLGLVWDLREPPERIFKEAQEVTPTPISELKQQLRTKLSEKAS